MDLHELERIVTEEVQRVLAEQQRAQDSSIPPDPNVTLDSHACQGPTCSMPSSSTSNPIPQTAANRPAPDSHPADGPAILLIFTGAREKWDVLSAAFQEWRNQGIALDAIFSSSAHYVITVDEIAALGIRSIDQPAEIRDLYYDLSRYSAVFLPSISRTHAAKWALGITDSLTLNMAMSALAQNAKVVASQDGLDPTACVVCGNQVPGIQEILDTYRDQLIKMGVKLLPAEKAVKEVHRAALNKAQSGPELITSLMTEEDAAHLKGPVVRVARGGLFTPLALELLQKKGIEVVIVPQS